MTSDFINIYIIIGGIIFIIFHKTLGIKTAKFRENFLNFIPPRVKYSIRDIKFIQLMFLFMGILFVSLGFLALLDIVNVRP